MTISIVMATYNGEKYLTEQLDSLRLQTRLADEVIIQDDGSTDSTVQLVQEYIKKYDLSATWNFTCNEHNLGYAENFKTATLKSTGDLIFFCDQDDIWELDKIESMVGYMQTNHDINLLGSEFDPLFCEDDPFRIKKNIFKRYKLDGSFEHVKLNKKTLYIDYGEEGCTMCFRRTFLNNIKKYWFKGWAHDDFIWTMAVVSGGCFVWHKATMKRRFHSNNASKQKYYTREKRINLVRDLCHTHEILFEYAQSLGATKKELSIIKRSINMLHNRIRVVDDRNICAIIKSFFYFRDYLYKKSLLVDIYIAFFKK